LPTIGEDVILGYFAMKRLMVVWSMGENQFWVLPQKCPGVGLPADEKDQVGKERPDSDPIPFWWKAHDPPDKPQINRIVETMDENRVNISNQLQAKYSDVITDQLGECQVDNFTITLEKGAQPTYVPFFRTPPLKKRLIDDAVEDLEKTGVAEPSDSPFAAPVHMVPKPSKIDKETGEVIPQWRFTCDYRKLNEITVKDKFPLPRIDDILDMVASKPFRSTLDLNRFSSNPSSSRQSCRYSVHHS